MIQPNAVIMPSPQDILAPTVVVITGQNVVLQFNFSEVFINMPSLSESVVLAVVKASSGLVATVSRAIAGFTVTIGLSNTLLPGQYVSVSCSVTGSLGTQSAAFCYLVAMDSF